MTQPTPCAHCGWNFMRQNSHPDTPKICNNCILRMPKVEEKKSMNLIQILIECPADIQKEIEEVCINQGISFSEYFIRMYRCSKGQIFSCKATSIDSSLSVNARLENELQKSRTALYETIKKKRKKDDN